APTSTALVLNNGTPTLQPLPVFDVDTEIRIEHLDAMPYDAPSWLGLDMLKKEWKASIVDRTLVVQYDGPTQRRTLKVFCRPTVLPEVECSTNGYNLRSFRALAS